MRTLYLSQQGCWVTLRQECLQVMSGRRALDTVPLPTLEQVLVFGSVQLSTQAIQACLTREIPIAYLSRTGYCYGRVLPLSRGYRRLAPVQQALPETWRLRIARQIVRAKLLNGRALLMRNLRQQPTDSLALTLQSLEYLASRALSAQSLEQLRGLEGAGAALYFSELGNCIQKSGFILVERTRQPPTNPVNAILSFGYMVLWNHLLTLIELQDLDPYAGCLHAPSDRHPALVSDLLEEFRAPIVDSLMLWLVNRGIMDADTDFEYRQAGCFLNESGRKKYLRAFIQRMNGHGERVRWDLLTQQIRQFKACVTNPHLDYSPYRIR